MLFDSSLRKELGRSFSATLVVLLTVVVTVMLIRTLGQASGGSVNPSEVILVMGYTALSQLPLLLTLSLFISVTATFTRMYSSSEMVVWFASGQPLKAFLRPTLKFAWPVFLVIALLSLLGISWSNQQVRKLQDRYQGRGDIERVAPGQFIESSNGQRVFFIDKSSNDSKTSGRDIFITATTKKREALTTARSGHLEQKSDGRYLILERGQRLDTELNTGRMRMSEFAKYGIRISQNSTAVSASDAPRLKWTSDLFADPTPKNSGELAWRLGLLFTAINCVFFALATTKVNPRVGPASGIVFALLSFTAYYNLLVLGQSWISLDRINIWIYLALLHGGIFLLSIAWLSLRQGWRYSLGLGMAKPQVQGTGQ